MSYSKLSTTYCTVFQLSAIDTRLLCIQIAYDMLQTFSRWCIMLWIEQEEWKCIMHKKRPLSTYISRSHNHWWPIAVKGWKLIQLVDIRKWKVWEERFIECCFPSQYFYYKFEKRIYRFIFILYSLCRKLEINLGFPFSNFFLFVPAKCYDSFNNLVKNRVFKEPQ